MDYLLGGIKILTINILCIGKIKEKFFKDAIEEYSKRLSKYCKLHIIELPDLKIQNTPNDSMVNEIKNKESSNLIAHIPKDSYTICLDLNGKEYSSEKLASHIDDLTLKTSSITFIIGGSLGLNSEILNISDENICFSKLTFTHQMIRLFLLEQLFRSFKIINGESYHK